MDVPTIKGWLNSSIIGILCIPLSLSIGQLDSSAINITDSAQTENSLTKIFSNELIQSLPLRQTKDYLEYLPGVVEHAGNILINGSRNDEIDFTLNGLSIRDQVSGQQLIRIPKQALDYIGVNSFSSIIQDGNYGSGSIDYGLKSGGNKYKFGINHSTDNIGINSTEDFYNGQHRLGTYWYGFNETNISAEGPIIYDKMTFFANANYQFFRDRNPQLYPGVNNLLLYNDQTEESQLLYMPPGIVYGNSQQSYNLLGKVNFYQKDFEAELIGIFENKLTDAPRNHILDYFNRRLGIIEDNTVFISLSVQHKISDTFWYSASGSYASKNSETYDEHLKDNFWSYGDSVANAEAGIIWERDEIESNVWNAIGFTPNETRFFPPYTYTLDGFQFNRQNSIPTNYSKSFQSSLNFNADFNYKVNKNNTITFGYKITQLLIREWRTDWNQANFARTLNDPLSIITDESQELIILRNSGVNNIGYDEFGNERDSGFNIRPRPIISRVFLSDSYKKNNLQINFGFDFVRFDLDNYLFVEPTDIERSIDFDQSYPQPIEHGYKKSPVHTKINPKFYIQYSLSENSYISLLYNRSSSVPKLSRVYKSFANFYKSVFFPGSSYFTEDTYDNDLAPVQTNKIVIAFQHKLSNLNYGITTFFSGIEDQSMPDKIMNSDPNQTEYEFWTIRNGAISNIFGLSISVNLKNIKGFSLLSNISLQNTEGTNSEFVREPDTGENYVRNLDVPLDHQYSFSGMLALEYLFQEMKNEFLNDFKISMLMKFISGHPHSIGYGSNQIDTNPFTRQIDFQDVNAYYTPSNFQLNLRIDKLIEVSDKISLNLFVYALNLFNNNNIKDVFLRTGSAKDDGNKDYEEFAYLYGENYRTTYELTNISYNPKNGQQTMFGEPRQIIMGIKLTL